MTKTEGKQRYYFFCPNCGHEDRVNSLPRGTVSNIRDGYGIPIHHFECPMCSNLDAGYMAMPEMADGVQEYEVIDYFQAVIGYYQGIRGFAKKK